MTALRSQTVAAQTGRIALRAASLLEASARLGSTLARTRIAVGATTRRRLPELGLNAGGPFAQLLEERLKVAAPAHVGVDVADGDLDGDGLAGWLDAARRTGIPLEVRLALRDPDRNPDAGDLDPLIRAPGLVRRIILVVGEAGLPTVRVLDAIRAAMPEGTRAPQVALGTIGPFATLNRGWDSVPGVDAVSYALDPQVHADDALTILENLEAQPDMVRTARVVGHVRRVHVSPVTLAPRRPGGEGSSPAVAPEATPFGAAWTLGSVAALAWGGATSATYHGLTGRHAIVEPGGAGPALALFAALGRVAGARLVRLEGDARHPVAALGLETGGRRHVLVANLADVPCEVTVDGLRAATVRHIGETPGHEGGASRGSARVTLGAYDTVLVRES